MPDKIDILYDTASHDFDLGTKDQFRQKMNDPGKARIFFDHASQKYDLGDWNTFASKINLHLGGGGEPKNFTEQTVADVQKEEGIQQMLTDKQNANIAQMQAMVQSGTNPLADEKVEGLAPANPQTPRLAGTSLGGDFQPQHQEVQFNPQDPNTQQQAAYQIGHPQTGEEALSQLQQLGTAQNNAVAGTSGVPFQEPAQKQNENPDVLTNALLGIGQSIDEGLAGAHKFNQGIGLYGSDEAGLPRALSGIGDMTMGAVGTGISAASVTVPEVAAVMQPLALGQKLNSEYGTKTTQNIEKAVMSSPSVIVKQLFGEDSELANTVGKFGDFGMQAVLFGLAHKSASLLKRTDPIIRDLRLQAEPYQTIIQSEQASPELKQDAQNKLDAINSRIAKVSGAEPLIKKLNGLQDYYEKIIAAENEKGAVVTEEQVHHAKQELVTIRETIEKVRANPDFVNALRKQALDKIQAKQPITPFEEAAIKPVAEETTPEDIKEAGLVAQNQTTPDIDAHQKQIQEIADKNKILQEKIDSDGVSDAAKSVYQKLLDDNTKEAEQLQQTLDSKVLEHRANLQKHVDLTDALGELEKTKKPLVEELAGEADPYLKKALQDKVDEIDSQIKEHKEAIKGLGLPEEIKEPSPQKDEVPKSGEDQPTGESKPVVPTEIQKPEEPVAVGVDEHKPLGDRNKQELNQPLKTEKDATQQIENKEGVQPEHQNGNGGGKTAETSSSDSLLSSGEKQAEEEKVLDPVHEAASKFGWKAEKTDKGYDLFNRNGKKVFSVEVKGNKYKAVYSDGTKLMDGRGQLPLSIEKVIEKHFYGERIQEKPLNIESNEKDEAQGQTKAEAGETLLKPENEPAGNGVIRSLSSVKEDMAGGKTKAEMIDAIEKEIKETEALLKTAKEQQGKKASKEGNGKVVKLESQAKESKNLLKEVTELPENEQKPINEKYYKSKAADSDGNIVYEEVNGKPVKLSEDGDFFIHTNEGENRDFHRGKFIISEGKTGAIIGDGDTKPKAIKNANDRLEAHKGKLAESIKRHEERHGLSPRYEAKKQPTLEERQAQHKKDLGLTGKEIEKEKAHQKDLQESSDKQEAIEAEFKNISADNKLTEKEKTAQINEQWEKRQADFQKNAGLSANDSKMATIEGKIEHSNPLTKEEVDYFNENGFTPEGYKINEKGELEPEKLPENDKTKIDQKVEKPKQEPALKTADQKIIDAKAKLEAIRNKKNLEGQQGIGIEKKGFSFDGEELEAYKELVSGYIEKGIDSTKEIIKKLREDFGDLLAGATDKNIEELIYNEVVKPERIEEHFTTSAKNAINDPLNEVKSEKQTPESIDAEGEAYHKKFEGQWINKAAEAARNPQKTISTAEQAAYRIEKVASQKRLNEIAKEINRTKGVDPRANAEAKVAQALEEGHAKNVQTVLKRQGSIWGYFGRDRQKLIQEDFTTTSLFEKAESKLGEGKSLSEKSKELFRDVSNKIKEALDKLNEKETAHQKLWDEYTKKAGEVEARNKEIAELQAKLKNAKFPKEGDKTYGGRNKLVNKTAYEAAKQALRGKSFSTIIPPPELFTIAAYHLEAGSHEFADFSKKMIKDAGAKIKPLLKNLYVKQVVELRAKGVEINATPFGEILEPEAAKLKERRDKYVKTLQTRLDNLKAKNDAGNFSKPLRQPPLTDTGIRDLKRQIETEKSRANQELRKIELESMSWAGKKFVALSRYHVFNLLLDQNILGKIVGHTITEAIAKVADAGTENFWRTVFKKMNAGSELGKHTTQSIVDYYKTFMTSPAYADAWNTVKTGENSIDAVHGKQHEQSTTSKWKDIPGNLHNAEKTFIQTAEYKSSLERRLTQEVKKNGVGGLSDPEVRARIEMEAAADSVAAKLQNRTELGQVVAQMLAGKSNLAKFLRVVDRVLIPIRNVPANVVNATARRIGGLPVGLGEVLYHSIKGLITKDGGIKNLDPKLQDAIFKRLSQGSVGAVLIAAGMLNPDIFGGFYQRGRKDEDVETMGVGHMNRTLALMISSNPIFMAIQFGATIRRNVDATYYKQKDYGVGEGLKQGGQGVLEHIPYVNTGSQVFSVLESQEKAGKFAADFLAGYYVPGQVKRLAQNYDTKPEDKPSLLEIPKYSVINNPKGIKRQAKGNFGESFVQETEKNIPGLRENVGKMKNQHKKKATNE